MQILKSADICCEYMSSIKYKPSLFNISKSIDSNKVILFNTYTSAVILINKNEMTCDKVLVQQGFLVPEYDDEVQKVVASVTQTNNGHINHFTILPTTRCNAHCFYCYEDDYKKYTMSNSTIDSIIEYIVSNIRSQKEFVLDWFGGEPLLCTDIIDYIIEKIRNKVTLDEYKWSSIITTNAILFSNQLIHHAIKNWNLAVAHITIDGTEDDHNKRKGLVKNNFSAFTKTYTAIRELLKNGIYVNLRIHMDKQNIESLENILSEIDELLHFQNLHLYITPLFPPENSNDNRYYYGDEKEELFYKVYKLLLKKEYCKNLFDELPKRKKVICSATNKNEIVIAADGSLHRCIQEFDGDYDTGKFDDPFKNNKSCKKCPYFPICLGGCIHNRHISNRVSCVRNKYITNALLQLISEEISKKGL